MCDGTLPQVSAARRSGMCDFGPTWVTSLGRTRSRVLLAATRPSPMAGSRFVGARVVGPWVGEQEPLGKTPLRGNPSPESTCLPTSF